jgi:uncharacterized membrane protein
LADRVKIISFVALMAALANILSAPPLTIPITLGTFSTSIHFTQLPIFVAGVLAGPTGGLIGGALGGLFGSFGMPGIPFIIGGLAILGCSAGFFGKRLRPLFAGILAWVVQAPYVAVSDYVWFTLSLQRTPQAALAIVTSLLVLLTIEAVISAALADVVITYLKKAGITL